MKKLDTASFGNSSLGKSCNETAEKKLEINEPIVETDSNSIVGDSTIHNVKLESSCDGKEPDTAQTRRSLFVGGRKITFEPVQDNDSLIIPVDEASKSFQNSETLNEYLEPKTKPLEINDTSVTNTEEAKISNDAKSN